ncbi:hypothetical protein HOT99_gp131 [Caulobacter phage CcrBL10]|uniref:Uncharacterized protein n=1 Tax=Caulobacter phage CcrBL10 TaxID=2283269 RepID=A0A385E9T2_9CAUD|nr:hypothetical protein HOT99_gp131 [Caulobacter phage CcrBL10]AXQ68486.1 hypothetical protein CcrBL10_gp282 [Caulobacter phage CcrBL10]
MTKYVIPIQVDFLVPPARGDVVQTLLSRIEAILDEELGVVLTDAPDRVIALSPIKGLHLRTMTSEET